MVYGGHHAAKGVWSFAFHAVGTCPEGLDQLKAPAPKHNQHPHYSCHHTTPLSAVFVGGLCRVTYCELYRIMLLFCIYTK